MAEQMYEAYARRRGTTEWHPVLDQGLKFYATREDMIHRLAVMSQALRCNEYEMRPVDITGCEHA